MQRARAFFFVCLGILCLVAAYHFGARSAKAQVAGDVECVGAESGQGCAVVDHHLLVSSSGMPSVLLDEGAIPGTARAVACGGSVVVLADGSVWSIYGSGAWHQITSLPITNYATAAQTMSMGRLKAKYAK